MTALVIVKSGVPILSCELHYVYTYPMCAIDYSNTTRALSKAPFFGDVCLLGLGVTGRAVVDFFLSNPQYLNSLTIYSGKIEKEHLAYLRGLPESVIVHTSEETVAGHFDTAVVSPGIPPHSPLYQSAAGASLEVISEPELAWRISPQRWIAITGTNGKTTVTELTTALIEASGKTAWAAGNIGTPCIEIVATRDPEDWIVAELSSYQLHSTIQFAPDIALLLNITPDHLSWHGSHEKYSLDKQRVLANLSPDSPVILDVCLPETRAIANRLAEQNRRVIGIGKEAARPDDEGCVHERQEIEEQPAEVTAAGSLKTEKQDAELAISAKERTGEQTAQRITSSGTDNTAATSPGTFPEKCAGTVEQYPESGFVATATQTLTLKLTSGIHELLHVDELQIKGPHNLSNALAAAAAVAALGATAEEINAGLASFYPLAHRFEPCGEFEGISFINDSKATNIDAAVKAILAFTDDGQQGTVVALFGGVDKGTSLDELTHACKGPCRSAVCYGEAGKRFFEALDPVIPTVLANNLNEAFALAVKMAEPGDTVLLSPACASFDEFDSFETRGEWFKERVAQLGGEQ